MKLALPEMVFGVKLNSKLLSYSYSLKISIFSYITFPQAYEIVTYQYLKAVLAFRCHFGPRVLPHLFLAGLAAAGYATDYDM